jgi:hypothetical protein
MKAGVVALLLVLGPLAPAAAHDPPRMATREMVRIQGHRGTAPKAAKVVREVVLVALGTEHRFYATDWQRFGFSDPQTAGPAEEPRDRFVLQGRREDLARFAAARPAQTVTILAERRPGSADLFLLTLDFCPP